MQTPADLYVPSNRPYPLILPEITYPDDMVTRKVHHQGDLKWKGRQIYLSETLVGELVGCRQIDERLWDIYFGPVRLAQLDTYEIRLIHLPKQSKRRKQKNENMDLNTKKVLPMYPV